MDKKAFLIILDGWGYGRKDNTNAIYQAETPFFDSLIEKYPNATLTTHGRQVGLPEGQMGNSEVGHLNLGAGRIVYQDLLKINKAIEDKSLFSNKNLLDAIEYAREKDVSFHIMGLVSDGGVHSHIDHLKALIEFMSKKEINLLVHAFTDGRDTDPKSGTGFIRDIQQQIQPLDNVHLASLIGRYYAMDRDNRWERIKLAYDLLTKAKGEETTDFAERLKEKYAEGETDEFIRPLWNKTLGRKAQIKNGDVVLFFNFRTDRPRQLTMALTQKEFPEYEMAPLDLNFITMTRYDESFQGITALFEKDNLKNTIGEVISNHNKTQLRIAETEKYPHVSFFFSGGREKTFPGEERLVIDSPKVATYDLQPEMSAFKVSEAVIRKIKENAPDFICLNYANADMVGHTGDFEAVVEAVQAVDQCLKVNVETALDHGYEILIIADHGNADLLINEDGSPNTAHTKNPVPLIYVSNSSGKSISEGILADVAPTVLQIMNIKQPGEMTGKNLLS